MYVHKSTIITHPTTTYKIYDTWIRELLIPTKSIHIGKMHKKPKNSDQTKFTFTV